MPVYAIQAGSGPIKIGYTSGDAYASRIVKMQVDNAEPLRVVRLFEGDRALEAELHQRFRHLRVRGEWFAVVAEEIMALRLTEWVPLARPAKISADMSAVWTPERREAQRARQLASWGDPVLRADRVARANAKNAAHRASWLQQYEEACARAAQEGVA